MVDLRARLRAMLVLLVVAVCSWAVVELAAPCVAPEPTVEGVLLAVLAAALVACWAWVALVAALTAISVLLRGPARGAPSPEVSAGRRVRGAVAAFCGCGALALAAAPAFAGTPDRPADRAAQVHLLEGLPLPDRAADSVRRSRPVPGPPRTVTVRRGDTLWGLATRLGSADSVNRWRSLYAANRDDIGPDPDLILPGQHLVVPDTLTDPATAPTKETDHP